MAEGQQVDVMPGDREPDARIAHPRKGGTEKLEGPSASQCQRKVNVPSGTGREVVPQRRMHDVATPSAHQHDLVT